LVKPRLEEETLDRSLDLAEFRLSGWWSGDQHHVPPWGDCGDAQTNDLAQPAAHLVSRHGIAYSFADREAEATAWQLVRRDTQHEQAMGPALPVAADFLEAITAAQPILPLQGLPSPLSIGNRWGEALAPLQATPLDDVATIPGAHTLTKTVNTQPPAHLGLESPFGHRKDRTPFFGSSLVLPQWVEIAHFV
jgi:hypothetical protein